MLTRSVAGWVREHPVGVALGTGVVVAHGAVIALFAMRNPYTQTIFPPCFFLHITGCQCPGCGGTRALYSLLHGDVVGSLAMNPLVIAGYLALALALSGIALGRSRRPGVSRLAQGVFWVAAVVVLGATVYSGIIRNLG